MLSAAFAPAQMATSTAAQSAAAKAATRVTDPLHDNSLRPDVIAYEAEKLGSTGSTTAGATTTASGTTNNPLTGPAPAHSIGFDLGRMAVALVIVLGLIFGARWLFTHFFAGARAPATSRAVKVLSRTSLAPRQQVLLLQVGRRVVVVGESNGQLTTLSQMDDPDEVAALVGQLQEEQIQRAASFGGLFGRAQRKMDAHDEHSAPMDLDESQGQEAPTEPGLPADARSELSGLLEKVRSIRNGLGR